MSRPATIACALAAFSFVCTAEAQLPPIATGYFKVELQSVATGLSSPVELVSANDGSGRLFIVEQAGRIRILQNGALNATPFLNLTGQVRSGSEEGLLGLAFHPGFAASSSPGFRKLYTFTTESPSGAADFTVPMSGSPTNQIVITEWQASASNPDVVDTNTRRVILRIDHPQGNHNGGKIAFRPSDGYLYFGIGDGGAGNDVGNGHTPNLGNAQDVSNLLGKISRIDPLPPALTSASADAPGANGRYRVPRTNPFVGATGLDEIYAYGFRNPYRFSFDPATDRLIAGDVGQGAIEEVDLVQRGGNYGWNRKEGSFLFNPSNGAVSTDSNPNPAFINPVLEYDHGDGISVIGGFVYRGGALSALAGRYLFGDFLRPGSGTGRLFEGNLANGVIQELAIGINPRPLGFSVKGFGTDALGEIYLVGGGNSDGRVMKIVLIPATPALLNLSTRARVEADDGGIAIAGFILTGSVPKTLALRALGPSLAVNGQPIAGRLTNPTLSLFNASGQMIDTNDSWMTHPRQGELSAFGLAPPSQVEAALVTTLPPGAYTAMMRGTGGATGIGLIELYDVNSNESANAVNLSTRGRVQTGDNVMIGGLIVGGATNQRVILRAIGPALTQSGVTGVLANPTIELINANGVTLAANDNWRSAQEAEISATNLAPPNDAESAIVRTLAPGSYTAIVRGVGNTSGVALVEVYRLTPQE